MLIDQRQRTIRYIRVSVTDRCNLRCCYCMPEEGVPLIPHADILRYEEIAAVLGVAVAQGIDRVRLTGGEPLVRRGIASLVAQTAALPGLTDLALTTNGLLLPALAKELKGAGLQRINIGLPSLDPRAYGDLTRGGDLTAAIKGLECALEIGFDPVKINVVMMRGVNDDPGPFLDLTRRWPVEVRFIEYMPIGPADSDACFVSAEEFRRRLDRYGPFVPARRAAGSGPAGPAQRIPGAPGSFARIAAISEHFCGSCNRLRLTADGHLRLCLFHGKEIDLKPALRPTVDRRLLAELLEEAISQKPVGMPPDAGPTGRRMSQIGG